MHGSCIVCPCNTLNSNRVSWKIWPSVSPPVSLFSLTSRIFSNGTVVRCLSIFESYAMLFVYIGTSSGLVYSLIKLFLLLHVADINQRTVLHSDYHLPLLECVMSQASFIPCSSPHGQVPYRSRSVSTTKFWISVLQTLWGSAVGNVNFVVLDGSPQIEFFWLFPLQWYFFAGLPRLSALHRTGAAAYLSSASFHAPLSHNLGLSQRLVSLLITRLPWW